MMLPHTRLMVLHRQYIRDPRPHMLASPVALHATLSRPCLALFVPARCTVAPQVVGSGASGAFVGGEVEDDDALSVISSVDGSVIEAGGAYPGTRFPEVADAKRSAREQVAVAIASYEQQLAAEKAATLARMKYVHVADRSVGWGLEAGE